MRSPELLMMDRASNSAAWEQRDQDTSALQEIDPAQFLTNLSETELVDRVRDAQRIVIPSEGRASDLVVAWLRNDAGLDVPEFVGKRPDVWSEGREYVERRSSDAPRGLESNGLNTAKEGEPIEVIGFAGLDKYLDYRFGRDSTRVAAAPIAEPDCRFVIAGPEAETQDIRKALLSGEEFAIGTSLRNILEYYRKINGLAFADIVERDGKVEGMIATGEAKLIADITQSGESLRDNKLAEVSQIVPFQQTMLWRKSEKPL